MQTGLVQASITSLRAKANTLRQQGLTLTIVAPVDCSACTRLATSGLAESTSKS